MIDNDDIEATMDALMNEYLGVEDVDGSCGSKYHHKLCEAKKNEEAVSTHLYIHVHVYTCIYMYMYIHVHTCIYVLT